MTLRSALLGLVSAIALAAFCYFCDTEIRAGAAISSLMPVVAYGGLVVFLICVNPLLRRGGGGWALRGSEVAVILALFLFACGIPGWGLAQMLPPAVMMPHHDARITPGWKDAHITELVPKQMLADASRNESVALDGFVTGLAQGDQHIGLSDVPWSAWTRTLWFWMPLIVALFVAVAGLAAVFHRQWSEHEQIPYPIPMFANALLPTEEGRQNSIFVNRLFWIGFGIAFVILMNNYACRWWPQILIPIPLSLNFSPLMQLFPLLVKGKASMMFYPQIILPVVGLAYLIGSDVSVSMFIGPYIYCLIAGIFAGYGIELRSGKMMALTVEPFIFAGGYFGILAMVLYTGRRYYGNVFRRSLGIGRVQDEVPDYAVLGMRLFLAGTLLFMVQLTLVGIDWYLALIYTFFLLMIHIVVSRSIAETGAFHVGTFVYPGIMLWGMFGAQALGPSTLVTLFLVCTMFAAAPGWCPMPFIAQALKVADLSQVRLASTVRWGTAVILVTLAVAVPATIYWQYDRGSPSGSWPRASSRYSFENGMEIVNKLKAQGMLETASTVKGLDRLRHVQPSAGHLTAFAITAVLALAVGLGRLRFANWPLHPVMFLFLGGHQGMLMSFSYGLGWLIKTGVTKYGGGRLYHTLKPLMIGLIAGSMMGSFVPMLIGIVYYFITGGPPKI